jgi:NAD-dependent dihydropyrimidine dehydrogenase PreA subunit
VTLFINQELCDGCGACVEACPNEAISVLDGKAGIDELLCTSCESCASLCPVGAIQNVPISTPTVYIPNSSVVSSRDVRIAEPQVVEVLVPNPKRVSLMERLGVALFSFGREVLPYAIDGLVATLEQRIASPRVRGTMISSQPTVDRELSRGGVGSQQRRRRRVRRGRV